MGLKTGEFTDRDIASVDKVITTLKYLNQGREVKFDQWTVKMGETHKGGFSLLWKTRQSTTEDPTETTVWLGMEVTLHTFSEMCNELTDKEITVMQANMALQSINLNKRR